MNIRCSLKVLAFYAIVFCAFVRLYAADPSAAERKEQTVKHVDAKQAEKLVSEHKVIVLDIRTPEEFKSGHIAGATNVDFNAPDFEETINSLSKTNAYLVHCAVGGRSTRSLKLFVKHQFESIYHLDGGIEAWEKADLPTEK